MVTKTQINLVKQVKRTVTSLLEGNKPVIKVCVSYTSETDTLSLRFSDISTKTGTICLKTTLNEYTVNPTVIDRMVARIKHEFQPPLFRSLRDQVKDFYTRINAFKAWDKTQPSRDRVDLGLSHDGARVIVFCSLGAAINTLNLTNDMIRNEEMFHEVMDRATQGKYTEYLSLIPISIPDMIRQAHCLGIVWDCDFEGIENSILRGTNE